MPVTMTMLFLSHRIARGFSAFLRPLRRGAAAAPGDVSVGGLASGRIDVDAMRRMW